MNTKPYIIELPKILDERGNLSFFENNNQIPFEIKRTYWIYDVPGGETRGGHAFKEQQEFIVALSGAFDVVLNDGKTEQKFHLNRSYYGLYVPSKVWRQMENFSTNSLALVVSDKNYAEADYIRDFNAFKASKMSSVFDCSIIPLTKINDRSGNITVVENSKTVPFDIKRIFYLYDIPGGESRGAHAHKQCHQFLIAASGSFEVLLEDGLTKRQVQLNRANLGLYIPPGIWASEVNFSSGSICLVLASHQYNEKDYIREYDSYQEYISRNK